MRGSAWGNCFWAGTLIASTMLALPTPSFAGHVEGDLARDVGAHRHHGQLVRVIVQFTSPDTDPKVIARRYGAKLLHQHRLIGGATLFVPEAAVTLLAHDPDIASVSYDHQLARQW